MIKLLGLSIIAALALTFSAAANSIDVAEDLIAEAIMEEDFDIDVNNIINIKLTNGSKQLLEIGTENLQVTNLDFDAKRGSFSGFILANNTISLEISGKYYEVQEIPVVNRKIRSGEIITKADITYTEIDTKRLTRGYVTNEDELIGQSPTRTLFKDRPVMPSQIAAPTLVNKKQAVTMIFKNNVLEIQDLGVAMEDGGEGDLIRVRNQNSNVIIHARVISSGLVAVENSNRIIAQNLTPSYGTRY